MERNFYFCKAARNCRINSGNNPFNMASQNRPLSVPKRHNGDFSAGQILLIPDVLVCRYKNLEPRGLGGLKQVSINKPLPAAFNRLNHQMAFQSVSERGRRTVVKQDEHLPPIWSRPAAVGMGQDFAPQIRERLQSVPAPGGTIP